MIAIKWYALKITIGEEEAVEKQLKNAGFEVLNPKYQLRERKNGQWREKEKYLLSGYVLVKTELTAEIYYQLKNMWYISYLLKGEIKETEIEYMKSCALLTQASTIEYRQNQIIYSGGIKDHRERIVKVDKRKERALISFELGEETILRWLPVKIIKGKQAHK